MDSPAGPLPPEDAEAVSITATIPDRRALVTKGLIWTGMLQVFLVGANFLSMIVLVRLLSPIEYGRVAAVNGITALINCFSCSYFIAQAIQLHDGEEPDWGAHWRAGFYIQLGLFIACNLIATICWFLPPYRPIAGLLYVASVGFLLDFPNQVGLTRLRRDLNYRTLRLVQMVCTLVTVASSISLALLGAGAFALIIGYNLLHGVPQGVYLLVVEKWKPPAGWWRWPNWKAYRAPLKFGAQLSGSALFSAARGMLEAVVLPITIGYAAVGLLNRAQVLFSTTGGRAAAVVVDTVYPLLPRSAGNAEQFARHATLFIETMLFISIPSAVFIALDGPQLSRLLYGEKWIAADPLIVASTIFAWAVSTTLLFTAILQARNRLRLAFLSSVIAAASAVPAMIVALGGAGALSYAWALAIGQFLAACIAGRLSSNLLQEGWFVKGILPSLTATSIGALCLFLCKSALPRMNLLLGFCFDGLVFATVVLLIHRFLFPRLLREIVARLPGSNRLLNLMCFGSA